MTDDKTIKIGIDSSGVASGTNEVKSEIQRMYDEMERIAISRNTRSKDILKDIQEQIKAQERLNQISTTEARVGNTDRLFSGEIDKKTFAAENRDISQADKEARLNNMLLQGILDELRRSAKEELKTNEKEVLEGVKDKDYDSLTLKQRLQRDELGEREQDNRGIKSGISRFGGAAVRGGGNMIETGFGVAEGGIGMLEGAGGALAVGAVVAGVALMAAKSIFTKTQEYEKEKASGYATTGDRSISGMGMSDYGYSAIEVQKRVRAAARNRRSGAHIEEDVKDQMILERGIGLSEGEYGGMGRQSFIGGSTGMKDIQSAVAAMKSAGIVNGDDMSAVPDYLNIMVGLGKEQLSKLGRVDVGVNTKMVAALGSMDDTLKKSPEALSTMVNAIRGGLSGGGSAQSEALKFGVLSSIAPGADMFELQKMKEDPFSKGSEKYLPKYLEQLKKMGRGNQHRFYQNIMSEFGLSASMAEILGKGYDDKTLTSTLNKNFRGKEGITDLEGRAKLATTTKERDEAFADNGIIILGDYVGKILAGVEKLVAIALEEKEHQNKIATDLIKSNNIMDKFVGSTMMAPIP